MNIFNLKKMKYTVTQIKYAFVSYIGVGMDLVFKNSIQIQSIFT